MVRIASRESLCQFFAKKGRETSFFGTDFTIIANIITNSGPDSRIDRSGGNLNRGFSMKNYPDAYFLNIPSLIKYDQYDLLNLIMGDCKNLS